jgi:hypothetical protein
MPGIAALGVTAMPPPGLYLLQGVVDGVDVDRDHR